MRDVPQDINLGLLAKFLSEEASSEEVDMVLEWLDASDENQNQFSEYEKVWSLSKPRKHSVFDADVAWQKVNRRIAKRRLSMPMLYSSVAAAVILFAVFFAQFNSQKIGFDEAPLLVLSGLNKTINAELPDGSDIMLFPDSEIKYHLNNVTNTRTAKLQGEAFFSVKRDTLQKFIVNTPYGGVEVLGTKFNVEVQTNSDVLVDVLSGKVKLFLPRDDGDTLFLIITNKESAIISIQNNSINKCVQESSAFYRVDETLTFRNTPIRTVFSELEKCYSATIDVDSAVPASLKLTSSFKGDSIEEVLTIITETLSLKWGQSNGKYLITRDDE